MVRMRIAIFLAVFAGLLAQQQKQKAAPPPAIEPKAEELARVKAKTEEIESILKTASTKDAALRTDVEVYAKAGRLLLEFPQTFFTQAGIDQAMMVLD